LGLRDKFGDTYLQALLFEMKVLVFIHLVEMFHHSNTVSILAQQQCLRFVLAPKYEVEVRNEATTYVHTDN